MKDVYTRFYKDVPAEQVVALQQFRAAHPICHLVVNGVDWEYYTGGQGDRVLLLLTGGTGAGEALHFYFRQFEAEGFRLITPNYPPVTTIQDMMDGLIAILDHEGVEKVSILGQSMGGLFAQVLVRRVPERIDAIVLSHTLTASPPLDSSVVEQRVMTMRKGARIVRFLPNWLIRVVMNRSIDRHYEGLQQPDVPLIRAIFRQVTARLTRGYLTATYAYGIDFSRNYHFYKEDLESWPGRILILESSDDKAIRPEEREAIRRLYPRAEFHTFQDTGHLTLILKRDETFPLIREFLK